MSTSTPVSPPPPKPEGEKEEEVDPEIVLTDVVKDEEAAAAGANEDDDVHTQADSEDSPIPEANKPVDSKRTCMVQLISIAILLIIAIVAVGILGALGVFGTKSKSVDPVLSESENFQQGDGDGDAPGPAPVDDPGTGQFDGWFDNDWVINEDPSTEEDPPPEEDPWEDEDLWDETNNFSRSWYFEDGLVGPWRALGGETTVSLDTSGRIEGRNSLLVGGRSDVLHGAGFELIGLFLDQTDREEDAIIYSFSGCITLEEEGQCYFVLTTENANGDVERIPYEAMMVYPMSVTEFGGEHYIEESEAPLVSAVVSVECIDPNVDFYLDAMFVSVVLAEEE